jgi:hypothetical protein
MKQAHWVVLTLVAVLLSGCDITVWEIQLRPRDEKIERQLTVYQVDAGASPVLDEPNEKKNISSADPDDLARVEGLYPKRLPGLLRGHKASFVGTFGEKMPGDVGGAGSYVHYATSLGTSSIYVERFRGEPDQAAVLLKAFEAIDRITDHLTAWLKGELAAHENWGRLEDFMNREFRRDMKNLLVYIHPSNNIRGPGREKAGQVAMVRIIQYLAERGYFSSADVPAIRRAFSESGSPDDYMLKHTRRLLAKRMGLAAEAAESKTFAFLATAESAQASIETYLASTPDYKALVAERKEEAKSEREKPEPGDVIMELIKGTPLHMKLDIFGDSPDAILLLLETGTQPWMTNGKWDAETGKVVWEQALPDKTDPPQMCFALWSSPDEAQQTKHFGRVALASKDLFNYCLWRAALTEAEATEWDAFVASLEPGKNLKRRLERFRFSGEPTQPAEGEEDLPESHAANVVDVIVGELFPDEDKQEKTAEPEAP